MDNRTPAVITRDLNGVILRRLELAVGDIRDGDLLMKRADPAFIDDPIAAAGRSPYVHAGMAAWWGAQLMCLETVQFAGARAVLLEHHVAAAPGRWDVFETNPDDGWTFSRERAVQYMICLTGTRYGWLNLAKAALTHLAATRLFVRANMCDDANGSPPFCSQAVASACRAGGVDPVKLLADVATVPGDLARSMFFRYRFTLI